MLILIYLFLLLQEGYLMPDYKVSTSITIKSATKEKIWPEFRKIAHREGKNHNELIEEFVINYVKLHADGNPQSQITTFAKEGVAAYPTLGRDHKDIVKFLEKLPEKDLKFMHDKALNIQNSCVRIAERHRVERRS